MKTMLPMDSDNLRLLLDDMVYSKMKSVKDTLSSTNRLLVPTFCLVHEEKLSKALRIHSSNMIEQNKIESMSESDAVVRSFLDKLHQELSTSVTGLRASEKTADLMV